MCLPINFLKALLIPSIMINIIIGFIPIIGLAIINAKGELTIPYRTAMASAIYTALFMFCMGIVGFFGYKHMNKKMIGAYMCYLIIFSILMPIEMAYCLYISIYVQNLGISQCDSEIYYMFPNIQQQTSQAQNLLCTSNCQCYIQNTTFTEQYKQEHHLDSTDIIIKSDVVKYQECLHGQTNAYTNIMAQYENDFDCAGWCQPSPIYLFSDVNRGIPNTNRYPSCFGYFIDEMVSVLLTTGFICLFLLLCLIMMVLASICYCCHPDKDRDQRRMYCEIHYRQAY